MSVVVPTPKVLKYAGAKTASADAVIRALRMSRTFPGRYVEPFVGSGAVFLALRTRGWLGAARLCDASVRLVQTHLAVRLAPDAVLREMDRYDWSPTWKDSYLANRATFNAMPRACLTFGKSIDPDEVARVYVPAAAMFFWLNRTCFNGLYRTKLNNGGDPRIPVGGFNVPAGSYRVPGRPAAEDLQAVSRAFQNATIWHGDFAEGLQLAKKGDRAYLDPPYVPVNATSAFTSYSGEFGMADQIRLRNDAILAANRGARVVLSNHDLPVVREEVYPTRMGFQHVASLDVARPINSKGDKRQPVKEILVAIGDPT